MRPTILITGASSGLGKEYALQLAAKDDRELLLVARRGDRLAALAEEIGPKAHIFTADLTSFEERSRLVAHIRSEGRQIELLINNAGFGTLGGFATLDVERELEMVELNCKAPLHLTHAFLDDLRDAPKGAVINVCSTAAFQSLPYMSTYGATKSFLLSLTVALSAEFGSSIYFLAHCPGPTRTEFHLVVGLPEKLNFIPSASAKSVVAQALKRLDARGSSIIVNGFLNGFLAQLNRLFPRKISAEIVAKVLHDARNSAG